MIIRFSEIQCKITFRYGYTKITVQMGNTIQEYFHCENISIRVHINHAIVGRIVTDGNKLRKYLIVTARLLYVISVVLTYIVASHYLRFCDIYSIVTIHARKDSFRSCRWT